MLNSHKSQIEVMENSAPKTIAIVTGGYSSEFEIAYKSAQNIYRLLSPLPQYQVFYLDLRPKAWEAVFWENSEEFRVPVDKNDFSICHKNEGNSHKIKFDLALIIMHGSPGEDGKLQSYFELIGQKYLACSSFAAAVSNHKYETNMLLAAQGILCAQSILLRPNYCAKSLQEWLQKQSFPLFVKTNTGGSSIAMSKIKSASELPQALEKVFQDSPEAMLEAGICGREFTVGVYKLGAQIYTLPITEIRLSEEQDFFDFEAKYSGKTQEITPAQISEELVAEIREISTRIYAILHLAGIVRLDFIYQETEKKIYFLEANTIPGQTQQSILPQQIACAKIDLQILYSQLINQALIDAN